MCNRLPISCSFENSHVRSFENEEAHVCCSFRLLACLEGIWWPSMTITPRS